MIVKGGGHGDFHNIVIAPASAQDMYDFVMDKDRLQMSLPLMNSYQRLLVHRCADTFSLLRDVDAETKAVSLKKTSDTKM